jgi:hypothetical protein
MIKGVLDDVLLAVEAGATIAGVVSKLIDSAKQANLLTPEESAAYQARMEAAFQSRRYLPDDQLPNPSA